MNKTKHFRFISIISVFLILSMRCAKHPLPRDIEIRITKGSEIQITKDPVDQKSPAICGNRIVWQDFRNGNWDIYMYDLATKEEIRITSHPAKQINPAISGNVIVWEDHRKENPNIYMFDLDKNKIDLVNPSDYSQKYPAISGDRIIWVESKKNGWLGYKDEFCVYDLSNSEKSEIFSFSSGLPPLSLWPREDFDPPAISGEWAVISGDWTVPYWESIVSHNVLLIFNVVKKEKISLGKGCFPSISENKVVWFGENTNSDYDLKVYDLISKTTTLIFSIFYYPKHKGIDTPRMSGNWIVYTDYRNDRKRVYVYDLENKKETQLSFNPSKNPAISGNRIVWAAYRNKNWDIYMYELTRVH